MKITYIYHSGFAFEKDDTAIIFDYYKEIDIARAVLSDKKQIYFFSSHSHPDHFSLDIFSLAPDASTVKFILGSDIARSAVPERHADNSVFLAPGDVYNDELLNVTAYESTDAGCSFYVEFGGASIFHAGDLNNWHWNESAPPDESGFYEESFLTVLESIAKDIDRTDILMFPTDPRLGREYAKGAVQFIKKISTGVFCPMHFWDDYNAVKDFGRAIKDYDCRYFDISKPGDSLMLRR